jgi:hypothetical protein
MANKAQKSDGTSGKDTAKPYVMMALTSRVQKTKWVVDTGATDHAYNNPELFESL